MIFCKNSKWLRRTFIALTACYLAVKLRNCGMMDKLYYVAAWPQTAKIQGGARRGGKNEGEGGPRARPRSPIGVEF